MTLKTNYCGLLLLLVGCFIFSCSNSSSPEETVSLQTTVTPANAGSVSPSQGEFSPGDQIQLTATPNQNWRFKEWNGDYTGTANPASVTMDAAKEVNAHFTFGFDEQFEQEQPDNWVFSDSRFSVTDGHLQFVSGRDQGWGGAFFDQEFTDFKIEARVARLESQGSIKYSIGFFIRSTGSMSEPPLNGYLFLISQFGQGSVFIIENGIAITVIPWTPIEQLNAGLGNFNTIAVNVKGNRFDLFANGEHLTGFTDSTFEGGFAGVAASTDTYSDTNGDHVVVWDYVKLMPAEDMTGKQGKLRIGQPEPTVYGSSGGYHIHGNID